MNVKLGVFAEGLVSKEMVSETKQALQKIGLKYKCRFELRKETNDTNQNSKISGYAKSKFKAKFNDKNEAKNGDVFLSFGGEIEMD